MRQLGGLVEPFRVGERPGRGPPDEMRRVLVVEDNEMNRDMLARRLARRGWEIATATNGREGLDMAVSTRPNVILLDMSLPEIDGWEVARILKSQEHTRRIPIIALTAHAMTGDRDRALAAGCDEFESKPLEITQLLAKMQALAVSDGADGVDG